MSAYWVLEEPKGPEVKDLHSGFIRKKAVFFCESSLRKGEVLAYGGLMQNLKDLWDPNTAIRNEAGLSCHQ